MNTRVMLLLAAVLALLGGALAVAQPDPPAPGTMAAPATTPPAPSAASAPATPTDQPPAAAPAPAKEPAAAVAPMPAPADKPAAASTPAKQQPPVADTTPPKPEQPTAATPPADAQAPAVTSAPDATQKPAAAETPASPTTPVVTRTPPAPEKPAAAKPPEQQQAPTPVVTTPAPATDKPAAATAPAPEKPAAATAPTQTPAPVVEAPTPSPKPTVVMTPLPEKRPKISKSLIERTSPAKYLFAAKKLPTAGHARAIGYYPKGCLAGGVELPVNGTNWQVMRLSRNRNWGHPELVRFLERFAPAAAKATGWPGILVGDMAQPRGGPLPWGHRSHQIGLDVDIWFKPMPDHRLSRKERDTISATHLVLPDGKHLNPKTWSLADAKFIRTAAEQPEVERVLVNARIKQELCKLKGKEHWPWMAKVRPWYGHDDHIHVRLKCPADSPHCRHQPAVPGGDGCSKKALAFWFSDRVLHPKPKKHPKPRKQIMLADLPRACKVVLNAPAKKSHLASEAR